MGEIFSHTNKIEGICYQYISLTKDVDNLEGKKKIQMRNSHLCKIYIHEGKIKTTIFLSLNWSNIYQLLKTIPTRISIMYEKCIQNFHVYIYAHVFYIKVKYVMAMTQRKGKFKITLLWGTHITHEVL